MPATLPTGWPEMTGALERALGAVACLLVQVRADRPVPSSPGWTVRDVAAHLADVVTRYRDGPEGRGEWVHEPTDLAQLNGARLASWRGRSVTDAVDHLRTEGKALIQQVENYSDTQPTFTFHGGGRVRADRALGLLVGELLVHGWDMAHAVGRRWQIAPSDVAVVVSGLEPALPGWVDVARAHHHTATYDIHWRGAARRCWRFHDGQLDVGPALAHDPVDCHVAGSAGTLLLVMYRRRSVPWAAATGRVVAWGRRPTLALGLPGRFHTP